MRNSAMMKLKLCCLIGGLVLLSSCITMQDISDAKTLEEKWSKENPVYSTVKTASGGLTPFGTILATLGGTGAALGVVLNRKKKAVK